MPPTPQAYVYCTQGDVEAVLSANGLSLSLDDNQTGTLDPTELGYLNDNIIPWATSRVNMYLLGRYDAADLATSFSVNDFTAIFAARRVRTRRGNPCPKSLQEVYEETVELLKDLKSAKLGLEEIAERTSGAIAWHNIHHARYQLRRSRVQSQISERTPGQGLPASTDLPANYFGAENYWLS